MFNTVDAPERGDGVDGSTAAAMDGARPMRGGSAGSDSLAPTDEGDAPQSSPNDSGTSPVDPSSGMDAGMDGGKNRGMDSGMDSGTDETVHSPRDAEPVLPAPDSSISVPDDTGEGGTDWTDDAGDSSPHDECTPEPASCFAPAQCLVRNGQRRCACPGYYDDVQGDGSQCRDSRFLSIAVFGGGAANLGYSMATDSSGNVYLAGAFQDGIVFGSLPSHATAGDFDAYVVKFDSSLAPIWSRRFGSTGDDRGFRVAVNTNGDVVLIGNITGMVSFDSFSLGASGGKASYVAKLSTLDGSVSWAHTLPSASYYVSTESTHEVPLDGWASDVAVDATDHVFVTGRFTGAFDFETPSGPTHAAGYADAYVVKYDADGAPVWVRTRSSAATTASTALAIDSHGDLVLTGLVDGAAVFDHGPFDGYGGADAFVMKLSPDGDPIWSERFGSAAFDCGVALAKGKNGEIIATGTFDADLTWDDGHKLMVGPARSVYLARLDTDGKPIWFAQMDSGDFATRALALAPMAEGIAVAGTFRSTLGFDDGTTLQTAALHDLYVSRFSNDGALSWAQRFGGADYDEAWDVVTGANGDLIVTGWFAGPALFGTSITGTVGWLGAPLLRLRP